MAATTKSATVERTARKGAVPPVHGLHHVAYRCRDAEETRHFYEDILGLPLVDTVVVENSISTTGDRVSFAHFFFEMTDGSMIAFFDLGDGRTTAPDPKTPAFVNHIAFTVDGEAELLDLKRRLETAGVKVDGPMVHETTHSIYFFDPNGVRMEFAFSTPGGEDKATEIARAHENLNRWVGRKAPR